MFNCLNEQKSLKNYLQGKNVSGNSGSACGENFSHPGVAGYTRSHTQVGALISVHIPNSDIQMMLRCQHEEKDGLLDLREISEGLISPSVLATSTNKMGEGLLSALVPINPNPGRSVPAYTISRKLLQHSRPWIPSY